MHRLRFALRRSVVGISTHKDYFLDAMISSCDQFHFSVLGAEIFLTACRLRKSKCSRSTSCR